MNTKEDRQVKEKVPVGAIFRHYKGKDYRILAVGRHSDTLEFYVVYQGLYESEEFGNYPIWVRSLEVFLEQITLDEKKVNRFSLIQEPSLIED